MGFSWDFRGIFLRFSVENMVMMLDFKQEKGGNEEDVKSRKLS